MELLSVLNFNKQWGLWDGGVDSKNETRFFTAQVIDWGLHENGLEASCVCIIKMMTSFQTKEL